MISSKRWSIILIAIVLTIAATAMAQDYRGKLQGTVADESGAAIPGAHVVLRNVATGVEVSRQSDDVGHFIFDFVDPGEYIVVVEQTGFKKAVQENVVVRNRGDITVD